jgi:hypothetical protein
MTTTTDTTTSESRVVRPALIRPAWAVREEFDEGMCWFYGPDFPIGFAGEEDDDRCVITPEQYVGDDGIAKTELDMEVHFMNLNSADDLRKLGEALIRAADCVEGR